MKISDLGEFGLIGHIQKLVSKKSSSALVGIGDDAAVVRSSPSHSLLVTTDLLIEGVHFDLTYSDFYSLGWKSAAVNLSDIAAMGGAPRYCLTALAIPAHISVEQVSEFYKGFGALLRDYASELIGGDTCFSRQGLCISVTAVGEVEFSRPVTRAGALPGDRVFVTGTVGDAAAGLELLESEDGRKKLKPSLFTTRPRGPARKRVEQFPRAALIERQLRPVPRVEWGRKLALSGCASAMIDLSDGLSSDLYHICEQSGVGAEIIADRVPLSDALHKLAGKLARPAEFYALSGGEDYELLFTVPPTQVKKLHSLKLPVTEIGLITSRKKISLVDNRGKKEPLLPSGFDHFRRGGRQARRNT